MTSIINTKLLLLILAALTAIGGSIAWQNHRQAALDAQAQANKQALDYAEHHPVQVELGATKVLKNRWK